MRTIAYALLGLAVLAGAATASAAVTGWTEGNNGAPIFSCPDNS
jgi:hypothetical protein